MLFLQVADEFHVAEVQAKDAVIRPVAVGDGLAAGVAVEVDGGLAAVFADHGAATGGELEAGANAVGNVEGKRGDGDGPYGRGGGEGSHGW